MRLGQELHCHLGAPKRNVVIWCVACLIHGCSLTRLPPWALLLHLPIPPHNENTQYIPRISKFVRLGSCTIKNLSGVKTSRVADTRAQLHRLWAQRTRKRVKNRSIIWKSIKKCKMYVKKIGEDHRAPITEEVQEFTEIRTAGIPDSKLSETSYFQPKMHFDDSVESTADSDLEDWESQKLLTSHLYAQKAPGELHAIVMQEREGKCTKHSSRSKGNFEVRKLRGNPMHCFHLSRETWSVGLCSQTLIRGIQEELFLKVTRITCPIRQDHQTLRNKNFMSNPSTSASVKYNDKRKNKDWHYRTRNTDLLNLDENKFDHKKKCHSNRNMHEMGEIDGAQELRADEVSVQKFRESRGQFNSSLPVVANARTHEFYELFGRFSRCWIKL